MSDLGVAPRLLRHRVERGLLVAELPGVYRSAAWPATPLGAATAALLWGGRGAVCSHRTAAWLWDLTDPPPFVELTVTGTTSRAPDGIVLHRSDAMWGRTVRYGLTVTSPYRLLTELGAVADPVDVERAFDELRHRRLVHDVRLVRVLEAHRGSGRRGSRALADLVDRRRVGTTIADSELEVRFLALVRRSGLPSPVVHHRVRVGGRSFVLDAAFLAQKVAVELDGRRGHLDDGAAFERDRRRDAELATVGWLVVRVTWRQLADDPDGVVRRLRRSLEVRSGRVRRARTTS